MPQGEFDVVVSDPLFARLPFSGKVKAIHIETGGFLGIGGKLVAIPEGKYTRSGDNVQLGMTADAVSKLPEVEEQS